MKLKDNGIHNSDNGVPIVALIDVEDRESRWRRSRMWGARRNQRRRLSKRKSETRVDEK